MATIRNIVCHKCRAKIGEKAAIKSTAPILGKLCPDCKKISLEKHRQVLLERNQDEGLKKKNSQRLKNNNPMKRQDVADKVSVTLKQKYKEGKLTSFFSNPENLKRAPLNNKITEAGRKKLSDRMKTANPMFDQKYRDQAKETFKRKRLSGEILYKRGYQHHLWKGNRSFADTVRCQLFPIWTKPCLERDNFACVDCKASRELTVHHKRPLREFIKELKDKYDIKDFSTIDPQSKQNYINEILLSHKLDDGETLCKSCHYKKDHYFRKFSS